MFDPAELKTCCKCGHKEVVLSDVLPKSHKVAPEKHNKERFEATVTQRKYPFMVTNLEIALVAIITVLGLIYIFI